MPYRQPMQISKRTMNWLPKSSAWEEMQTRNAKRRQMAQGFMSDYRGLSAGLAQAHNTEVSNVSTIAQYAMRSRLSKMA